MSFFPHCTAETKEAFAKLPREAKELFLSRVTDVERGFNQKLQGLAGGRKLAEEIKAAVPEPVRQYMTQHGLTEPQIFARLLELQQQSASDPAGYLRALVANNKLDPSQIFGIELPQPGAPLPVELVQQHPAYQQLATQFAAMQREVQAERARVAEAESRRFQAEYEQVVQQTDGDGKPLYPYIRLLADPMARIIESESEQSPAESRCGTFFFYNRSIRESDLEQLICSGVALTYQRQAVTKCQKRTLNWSATGLRKSNG